MINKKAFALMASAAAASLALSACSGEEEDVTAVSEEGEDVVIEFMHLWPEGSSKAHYDVVNDIITEYEAANEGVTVDLEVLSNEQYKDKLRVLSTSGDLPDVGMTWAAGFLTPYVDGNMFASLDDVATELEDEFVPGTVDAYRVDETAYGLPLELNIATVFYNTAIFEEYGVEPPETYEELLAAVEIFNEAGVPPIALGNRDAWTGSLWYMYLADRIAGPEALTQAISGEGDFTDPAFVEAAERIQELVDANAFVNGFNGLADQEAKSIFMSGQSPMYLIGSWDLPNYTTNEDIPQEFRDSIEYMTFPLVEGEGDVNSFVGGPGVGLFVAEESDVKEEAKDFVAYFIQEWGEQAVQRAGVIPATRVDAASLDLPQMYIDILGELSEASNITLFADVQMSPEDAQVHLESIQALFGGELTPEEFAEAHAEAIAQE